MPINQSASETLLDCIRNAFERFADLPALEGDGEVLTYRELDEQSANIARILSNAGVDAGQIVPILIPRSLALVVSQVAILRLGASYAPIDLSSPAARRDAMIQSLGPRVIITDSATPAPDRRGDVRLVVLDRGRSHSGQEGLAPWRSPPEGTPAYVMFTSGSTGAPKAVMVPASGIVRLVRKADFASFHQGARWAFMSSPAFDASTLEVWGALLNGGCCVVQELPAPSLDDLADFLVGRRIDNAWLTSSLFNAMVEDRCDALGQLSQLLVGGERVSARHARSFLRAFPRVRLINGYGPTENTTFTLCHSITQEDTDNPLGIPIGRPIQGTVVRIGTGNGEVDQGELLASGLGVALGYLNDATLTAEKFVEIDHRRWYRTGDVVQRASNGAFQFLGRVDRQVKIQGHRIELEEIELALASCPGVGQAAVFVRGDTAESRHLVACFTGLCGAPPESELIVRLMSERLPQAGVPKRLVPLERLPITINGKIDRSALDALIDRKSDESQFDTAWQSDAERELAGIWQQVLPKANIHRHANFAGVGGTSLLALRVSAHLRRQLGRELSPIDILRVPVLADQARCLQSAAVAEPIPDKRLEHDELPLTLEQQSTIAATELDGSGCAYLVHTALRLEGPVSTRSLRAAFETLANRHPMLRMLARYDGECSRARILERLCDGWWTDHGPLCVLPDDMRFSDDILEVINRPMSIASVGVMRVDYWPSSNGSGLLVWTVHHVSVDESSIERCLVEISQLIRGDHLSPVYGSPFGFSAFERALTDRQAARKWQAVFIEAFSGRAAVLERPPGRGREVLLGISSELDTSLKALCARLNMTAFTPLIVAYGMALQDVYGVWHRFVSTPFSRRTEPELIEPVGYLLNLRFVEAGARDQETPESTLARVHRALLDLQRPSFLSHDAISSAITAQDPAVLDHLNAFGFTWRLDPARTVSLGAVDAQLLRVPQQGARFGMCLHTASVRGVLSCSVEAVEAAFVTGKVEALSQAFLMRLGELCKIAALPDSESPDDSEMRNRPLGVQLGTESILRSQWISWVDDLAEPPHWASNFLRSGGSSLAAMRMSSNLKRRHGLRIDVGAFLANPTFGNLYALAVDEGRERVGACVWVGRQQAARVVLLLPGSCGHALGLFALAECLQSSLGSDTAVVIADLERMLQSAPPGAPLAFIVERTQQLIQEIGTQRLIGIAGFSLGSLLALAVARAIPGMPLRVCLIDGYAPRTFRRTLALRVECRLGRWLSRSPNGQPEGPEESGSSMPAELDDSTGSDPLLQPIWMALERDLAATSASAPNAHVHLIQAVQSVQELGLLWRRRSNGFDPQDYAGWQVHTVNARHLELPRAFASSTAELVAACVARSTAELAEV